MLKTAATALALVAGTTAGLALTGPGAHADGPGVQQTTTITSDTAVRIADAVQKAAAREGQKVSVAVVERSGAVKIVLRGDGSGPQTDESARRKAFTAVSFGKPTAELADAVKAPGASLKDIPGTLFLGGGVPVTVKGAPIAGIGVAGAPSGDLDAKIAQKGLQAVASRLG